MKRFSYNSRLYRDELEEKEHFKLYKQGKLWVVAGITVFSGGLLANKEGDLVAKADATTTAVPSDDPVATAVKPLTEVKPTSAEAKPASTAAPVSESAKPASQVTPQSATSDAKAVSADAKSTSEVTSSDAAKPAQSAAAVYTKPAANSVASAASQAVADLNSYAVQADSLADQNTTDTIVHDAGVAALALHQKQQATEVSNVLASAASVVSVNSQQANDLLASAISIVTSMNDAVSQAGAMVRDDANGVQASIVSKAQAAYEKVSLPDGVKTELDSYGDLVVTTSTSAAYQKVLASLATAGLMNQFRYVVDPANTSSMSISFTPISGISSVDADGNLTINQINVNNNQGTLTTIKINISGNKGDKFFVTVPIGFSHRMPMQYTDASLVTVTENKDGSDTITWTLDQDNITKQETFGFGWGQPPYNWINDLKVSPDGGFAWPGTYAQGNTAGQYGGAVPDGTILPVVYGGSNLDTKYAKVTYTNKQQVSGSITSIKQPSKLHSNQNYVYELWYQNNGDSFNNLGNTKIIIDLPDGFQFDPDATQYVLKDSFRRGPGANIFKVLPGNKLEIDNDPRTSSFGNGDIYFAGSFKNGVTGNQTFKVESFTSSYNRDNSAAAVVLPTNGAEKNYTANVSNYNSGFSYDTTKFTPLNVTVDNATNSVALNAFWSPWINGSGTLVIGNQANNVLANFVPEFTNNVPIKPTYTFQVPTGEISTGISLPLNQAICTNWNKDVTYNVMVYFSDGTSRLYNALPSGQTLSSISGADVTQLQIPAGAHVTKYEVTQSADVLPGQFLDAGNIGSEGGEAWYIGSSAPDDNDILAQAFTILGYVDKSTSVNTKLTITATIADSYTSKSTS
ncbi:KxYKxGKxW signal peptide domain-containing protein, partial [Furfurilactobacillus siliginis]